MSKNVQIGQKYQLLTVIQQRPSKNGKRRWLCQCQCGNFTEISTAELGKTKSCGCLRRKKQYEDLTNQKFGRLTVKEIAQKDSSQKTQWLCQCQCGKQTIVRANDLKQNKVLSCGCLGKEKRLQALNKYLEDKKNFPTYYIDMKNKKIGRLTVIKFDEEKTKEHNQNNNNKSAYWLCQCECGNIVSIDGRSLRNKHTLSCGCLQKEVASQNMKKNIQPLGGESILQNLVGQKFGKLTVIQKALEKNNRHQTQWVCECECGNIKITTSDLLKSKKTQSCGCIGKSIGNNLINQILLKNKINFKRQVKFSDLKDKTYLRFDFGIYDDNNNLIKLIEFDGRQHYDKTSCWYTDTLVLHDQMKNKYCENKHIPLLRLTKIQDITLENLLK